MILVCDHRGVGLEALLDPLRETGFEIQCSSSLVSTCEQLDGEQPDVIIVDPLSSTALAELSEIGRLRGEENPTPVLLVCDAADPMRAIEACRSLGVENWDIIHRDAPLEEYDLRIERLVAQAERNAQIKDLRFRASHDERTELLRPAVFEERLREHFSAAERHGLDMALVLLDLDRFGQVNKDYDHMVGDAVIAEVGCAIRETLRTEDVAGRIGGDEFALILPYCGPIEAAAAVHRLAVTIKELSGNVGDEIRNISISTSIGFETVLGGEVDSTRTLRKHAELALRQAKRAGGNRGVYYRSLK